MSEEMRAVWYRGAGAYDQAPAPDYPVYCTADPALAEQYASLYPDLNPYREVLMVAGEGLRLEELQREDEGEAGTLATAEDGDAAWYVARAEAAGLDGWIGFEAGAPSLLLTPAAYTRLVAAGRVWVAEWSVLEYIAEHPELWGSDDLEEYVLAPAEPAA